MPDSHNDSNIRNAVPARLGDAALELSRRGWAVFPLAPMSKRPLIAKADGGRGCLDATTDAGKICEWWAVCPAANIGIATGRVSGLFVLDVDPAHGGDDALAELERRHGPLHTVISHTGGGGQHYWFRYVEGMRNSAGKIGPGLDVRGDGGYVAAPPSIHANGRVYAWNVDCHPDETGLADAPGWLIHLLRDSPATGKRGELPENWRRLVADGVSEGRRNDALARLAGLLLRSGINPFVVRDLLICWNLVRCKPPLADDEVAAVVENITACELRRLERRRA